MSCRDERILASRKMKRLVTIKMVGPIPDARDFCEEQHSLIYIVGNSISNVVTRRPLVIHHDIFNNRAFLFSSFSVSA